MSPRISWQKFQDDVAKRHRGRPVGGPGQPDYIRGEVHGEAKLRKQPMSKAEVMAECQKGRREIVCNAGFRPSAVDYVNRYRPYVKLIEERTNSRR